MEHAKSEKPGMCTHRQAKTYIHIPKHSHANKYIYRCIDEYTCPYIYIYTHKEEGISIHKTAHNGDINRSRPQSSTDIPRQNSDGNIYNDKHTCSDIYKYMHKYTYT